MSPQLFDLQLADGAWGLTVATPHQIQVARHFAYSRVFLANQLVGKSALAYVVEELRRDPQFEFYCLVDSESNVEQLAAAVRRGGLSRPVQVLIELGYLGGRTGCRTQAQALQLARFAAEHGDAVAVCGVEGFEGLLRGNSPQETTQVVETFLDEVMALARLCDAERLFASSTVILSAGGSAFYDLVAERLAHAPLSKPTMLLMRSGCYLTHDSGLYVSAIDLMRQRAALPKTLGGGPEPALEVWAYLQSRPEPELAIVGFGKRDASYDDLPVPIYWSTGGAAQPRPRPIPAGHRVAKLNDQHCYLEVPLDTPLKVGDMIGFGISHPCLTFDKWRVLHLVDADYNVTASTRTYF
jgi:D-serine dehydratase